jgi:hypothetical protein
VISRAQGYVDKASLFSFEAARALDLYTVAQAPRSIALDLAHIDPDEEDRQFRALRRGDPNAPSTLLSLYVSPQDRILKVGDLVATFQAFDGRLQRDLTFVRVIEADLLNLFQEGREIEIVVSLGQFPDNQRQVKVDNIYVILEGAKAAVPRINCVVEHLGRSSTRLEDGRTVDQFVTPLTLDVPAFKAMADFQRDQPQQRLRGFFGRSPAARWRLTPLRDASADIDLTSLKEIQIGFDTLSIIAANPPG